MYDLEIHLEDRPGALATVGETLAAHGLSLEGGGAWVLGATGVAHFLIDDGPTAARALAEAEITVAAARPALLLRLDQDQPGQLGHLCRAMSNAGVSIQVQYSDHHGQLVLLVDQPDVGQDVAERWMSNVGSSRP